MADKYRIASLADMDTDIEQGMEQDMVEFLGQLGKECDNSMAYTLDKAENRQAVGRKAFETIDSVDRYKEILAGT